MGDLSASVGGGVGLGLGDKDRDLVEGLGAAAGFGYEDEVGALRLGQGYFRCWVGSSGLGRRILAAILDLGEDWAS